LTLQLKKMLKDGARKLEKHVDGHKKLGDLKVINSRKTGERG